MLFIAKHLYHVFVIRCKRDLFICDKNKTDIYDYMCQGVCFFRSWARKTRTLKTNVGQAWRTCNTVDLLDNFVVNYCVLVLQNTEYWYNFFFYIYVDPIYI